GASEPMPTPPSEEADYFAWSRRVQIDLTKLRENAKAVSAASDDYKATLSPDDLSKTVDLSSAGMSQVTLAWVLSRYVAGHADHICGEASWLKGLQGANGYAE